MFRRKINRSEEINGELSAGVSHLRNAASGAAEIAKEKLGEVRETLSERAQQAKENLGPIVAEQREIARKRAGKAWGSTRKAAARAEREAKKAVNKRSKRVTHKAGAHRRSWPKAVGLLAFGAAIGAIASVVTRKARQTDWEEFDVRDQAVSAKSKLTEAAGTAKDKASAAGQKAAEVAKDASASFKDKATQLANVVKQKAAVGKAAAEDAADEVGTATGQAVEATKTAVGKAGDAAKKVTKNDKAELKAQIVAASRNGHSAT